MTAGPSASVVIPVHNGELYLAEAVRSALDQTHPPAELIIVDDGSIDATACIVADLAATADVSVRYIHQTNQGPAAARNRGLEAAQGELIAFLDADDWWPDTSLSQRCACLLRHRDLSGVIGATQLMVETHGAAGRQLAPWGVSQPTLNLGGALLHRRAFERIGLFDEAFIYAEDAEWLLRAREAGLRFGIHPAVALLARRHATNMTNQIGLSGAYLARALRESLARRQRGGGGAADIGCNALPLAELVVCDP